MAEEQVGYLYKAAALLPVSKNNHYMIVLKSYYLTRCIEITKGYGLEKQFSTKVRCGHCCIAWNKETITTVSSIGLNKKQRYRIKQKKESSKLELLHSNKVEQICSFCKQSTITTALKPVTKKNKRLQSETKTLTVEKVTPSKVIKTPEITHKKTKDRKADMNVYSTTKDVFSLRNNSNNINKPQNMNVVKNNKKKKDKFAGLCQKAVLSTIKLREEKGKHNKLNLFLKRLSS